MSELVFENVGRRFGRQAALSDLNLRCGSDAMTCLIGPNGAGKSTALGLAAGLLAPSVGRITALGDAVRVGGSSTDVAYLPQQSGFVGALKVREVMEFACRARGLSMGDVDDALSVSDIEAVAERPVGELSGGWVRRLGLFVTLLPGPKVIILDEPFVGLDPDTLDRLVESLQKRRSRSAVILLSSHDFEVLDRLGVRLAVIDEGVLKGVESTEAQRSRVVYRSLLSRVPHTDEIPDA